MAATAKRKCAAYLDVREIMAPPEEKPFSLRLSEDCLAVLLSGEVPDGDLTAVSEDALDSLRALGVVALPQREKLAALLAGLRERGNPAEDVVLLKGRPPIQPLAGRIEWAGDFFSTEFVIDEATGVADYRRRKAHLSVEAGQSLACVIPPQEGKPGRDLLGRPVAPDTPRWPDIKAGRNVRVEDDGLTFLATAAGRFRWAAGAIEVDEVYRIAGSVGLHTGHISHPGAIEIEEDILQNSKVAARGDIDVKGIVEEADIESGGSLSVGGGITGGTDHRIAVGGSLSARFLMDAVIEAEGDILIAKEIVHSSVKARGAVIMPEGRLVGGRVIALGGVDIGQAGSEALVHTEVRAGQDHRLSDELGWRQDQIKRIRRNYKRVRHVLETAMPHLDSLSDKQRAALGQLAEETIKMKETLAALVTEAQALEAEAHGRAKPQIIVREKLWPEAVLHIGEERLRIAEETPGPVRATCHKGRIRLAPFSR